MAYSGSFLDWAREMNMDILERQRSQWVAGLPVAIGAVAGNNAFGNISSGQVASAEANRGRASLGAGGGGGAAGLGGGGGRPGAGGGAAVSVCRDGAAG